MDNGMDYYYSYGDPMTDVQAVYDPEQPLYAVQDDPPQQEPMELPPEPEDSPYDDPVVRHILSVPDENYRNRILSYLNESVKPRKTFHPALVAAALVLFFPVGLCLMYFGTRWGTFAKVVITVFVLLMALSVYEILVLGGIIDAPSLVETVIYIISELSGRIRS